MDATFWIPIKSNLLGSFSKTTFRVVFDSGKNLNKNFAVENVSTSLKLGSGINKLWFGFQI